MSTPANDQEDKIMKMRDRVYRDTTPAKLGTVVDTSADGDEVYEGETVEVDWDGGGRETCRVEDLDRLG